MKTVGTAEARRKLPELMREVEAGAVVAVGRRGKPAVVLVCVEDFRRLERALAYIQALELSRRLASSAPDALEVARAARDELGSRP